jgi:hypothetical protein
MAHKFSLSFKKSCITRRGPNLVSKFHQGRQKCYEYAIRNRKSATLRPDMTYEFLIHRKWSEQLKNWERGIADDSIWCIGHVGLNYGISGGGVSFEKGNMTNNQTIVS